MTCGTGKDSQEEAAESPRPQLGFLRLFCFGGAHWVCDSRQARAAAERACALGSYLNRSSSTARLPQASARAGRRGRVTALRCPLHCPLGGACSPGFPGEGGTAGWRSPRMPARRTETKVTARDASSALQSSVAYSIPFKTTAHACTHTHLHTHTRHLKEL